MTFKDSVFDEFDSLKTVWDQWGSSRNFWHTACTLDACLDFIVAARSAWTAADPSVKKSIASFQDMLGGAHTTFLSTYLADKQKNFEGGAWWDDYGWWGIAWLKSHENFSVFGSGAAGQASDDCYSPAKPITQACCLQLAHDCWAVMHGHAWDTGQFGNPPPVPGGCWNYKPDAGGVQNTVTNNLYLTLSIRLYLVTRNAQYLQAACDSFKWFGTWFLKGPDNQPNKKLGIFDQVFDSGTPLEKYRYWILERPVDGDEYNIKGKNPAYQKQQWTGDQGVFLGGLIGLSQAQDAVRQNPSIVAFGTELRAHGVELDPVQYIEQLIVRISWGATQRLFTAPAPRVLHESPLSNDLITNFYTDMATGKGVLMRYLAYARSYLSRLKECPPYDEQIIDTAKSICLHPAGDANGLGFIWDNKTAENVTPAGTNEDKFLSYAKDENGWNFTVRTIRLDGLAAGIPLRNAINV